MKYTIQRGLSAESLRSSLPTRSRARLPPKLPPGKYTLLLFPNDRDDVVLSPLVESALAEVADVTGLVVAAGGCFTLEGIELLQARLAMILSLSDFPWTDERYKLIREQH